jgi:hypothetical protein
VTSGLSLPAFVGPGRDASIPTVSGPERASPASQPLGIALARGRGESRERP